VTTDAQTCKYYKAKQSKTASTGMVNKTNWRTAVDNTEVAYSNETLIPIQQYTVALILRLL